MTPIAPAKYSVKLAATVNPFFRSCASAVSPRRPKPTSRVSVRSTNPEGKEAI